MNLKNFENSFDDVILKRGLDYYRSGAVGNLDFDGNTWTADVAGSDMYEVTVTITENGDITDTTCDCPYDWGDFCKHQAAVLYALRKEKALPSKPKKVPKKQNLETLLQRLDKETLLSIVLEFADRAKGMKEELLLRYSDKTDATQYAKSVIKSAIRDVSRRGFVEYGDVYHATSGANTVLEMADDLLLAGDTATAVLLCTVILDEMMTLIGMCDDSNGEVGGVIGAAIELIEQAAANPCLTDKDTEKLFQMIYEHALKPMYNGWTNWRMEILEACVPLCVSSANRSRLETYLSEQAPTHSSEWSEKYDQRQRENLQHRILKLFDGDTAAEQFIERHLGNSDLRRIAIQNAIDGEQYEKALALCLDGEKEDSAYAGLVSDWKRFRYEVYEGMEDVASQKMLARELVLKGEFAYYLKCKALYEKSEWQPVLQEMLEALGGNDYRGVYVKILIQEKLKLRLLEYCKKNIYRIADLYPHLLPEYKDDVAAIFAEYIRQKAAAANSRSHYRGVCDLIRICKKACGSIALTFRDALAAQYPKRPAFLDELSKI